LRAAEENKNSSVKKIRLSENGRIVDEQLYKWFVETRSRNAPISGKIIQEKALLIAKNIGYDDFKASNGWLEKFNSRNAISSRVISGESGDLDINTVSLWMQSLPTLIAGYDLSNVFNCDETGLFWRGIPDRTLALRSDECKGGKLAKERLTVLFTALATGEKLTPLVIGKSANPRCFKKRKPDGFQYYNNKSAWMTTTIFDRYLDNLNSYFRGCSRNILLFMDNASVHFQKELSNIKIIFLPPNTTSGC